MGPRGATRHSACPILCHSEFGPLGLSAGMWGHRVCYWSDCLPCWSHTPPLSVPPWQRESSPPWLPISAPPTLLDERLFFISLVSDFLAVQFSVSSGCGRRHSVSTYAAILVLCLHFLKILSLSIKFQLDSFYLLLVFSRRSYSIFLFVLFLTKNLSFFLFLCM